MSKGKNTSSTGGGGRSTTAAASRKARSGPVRVWSEASITVAISEDPPQFAKFTHGFERMSPNDSTVAIERTEREIFKACEEILDKRARKLARLIRQINEEEL